MEQYDVSPELKKLFEIKQKQRAIDKEYYQKILYNPRRPIEEGMLFDPAVFRYSATHSYHFDIFKKTTKGYFSFLAALSPILVFYYLVHNSRNKREELYRSGLVKYEDRPFKRFF